VFLEFVGEAHVEHIARPLELDALLQRKRCRATRADQHAVGKRHGLHKVVRDEHHGLPGLGSELQQQVMHRKFQLGVESRERFVEQCRLSPIEQHAREADALAQIARLLPEQTLLLTGAIRLADPNSPTESGVYNSIYVIDHAGSIRAVYDKVHLVPFGEYLPFEDVLERIGLQTLTEQRGGFLAGDRHRLIAMPGAPSALPLICYEIIFPGELASVDQRPGWIVNVTNDGWFGISSGPYQHLQQSRVTAIEEGVPVARAANTGVSAVIDPVGRMVASLPLGREGVLDAPLPRPIAAPVYARLGDAPAAVLISIALLAVLRGRFRVPTKKI